MEADSCPFCDIATSNSCGRVIDQNGLAILIEDGFPVTLGHSLVILRRHIQSLFDASDEERRALFQLIERAKVGLDQRYQPSAYNIGINDGVAAGQTIPHLHIHVIPRYDEPGTDPRGGIRWIIPERADYWSSR
ncbi:HIT family protein [Haliea sp. E17]|uniref:HIT family protein n=1 Tax=Haliea sp. E17 TaxID=3401576 RepID=UPI003AAB04E5